MPKISFLGAMEIVQNFVHEQTDQPTDRQTKRPIEAPSRSLKTNGDGTVTVLGG